MQHNILSITLTVKYTRSQFASLMDFLWSLCDANFFEVNAMNSTIKMSLVCLMLLVAIFCASMSISAEITSNDTLNTATGIFPDCTVQDTLSSASDKDFYTFELAPAGTVELCFEVGSGSMSSYGSWMIQLMDDHEQVILKQSVTDSSQGAIFVSPKIGLDAGIYYIKVEKSRTGAFSSKEYALSVDFTQSNCWEKEINDSYGCSNAIEAGVECHGLLSLYDDVDMYSIRMTDRLEGSLVFQPDVGADPAVGWKLELYDESRAHIVFSDTSKGRMEFLLSEYLQLDQTYYLKISSAQRSKYDPDVYTIDIVTDHVCDLTYFEANAPTCTLEGNVAYRQCKECQKIYDLNGVELLSAAVAATGHNTKDVMPTVIKAATCTEAGFQVIYCATQGCGKEVASETIPALGHRISDAWSVDEASDCQKAGKQSRHCLNEGCNYFEDQIELPPIEHEYQVTVADQATCVTDGVIIKVCKDCGYREDEVVEATGQHVFGEWRMTRESTCTVKGTKTQSCGCGLMNVLELELMAHVYSSDWTVDMQPTCTLVGSRSHHCVSCGHKSDVEQLAALGHQFQSQFTYDQQATCENVGSKSRHCERCDCRADVTEIPAEGHNYGEWVALSQATCINTGIEGRTCSKCGRLESRETTDALGHDFETDYVIDIPAKCEVVGSRSKHCSRCGAASESQEIPAMGHTYGAWEVLSEASCETREKRGRTCTACGHSIAEEVGDALGHDYTQTFTIDLASSCETEGCRSKHCRRCDARCDVTVISPSGHTFGQWMIEAEPTCLNTGTEARTCAICRLKESRSTASALGHDYSSEFTIDVQATCGSVGSRSRHCRRCDAKTDVMQIASTGHIYDGGVVKVASTAEVSGVTVFTCVLCGGVTAKQMEKLSPVMLDAEEKMVWNTSATEPMRFRSAAALADFVEVRVNGEVIPRDCYTLREGSTIVELNSKYLSSLELGVYTLEIVSTTGVAEAEFTIEKTESMLWIWISVGILAVIAIVACLNFAFGDEGGKKRVTTPKASVGNRAAVKQIAPVQNQLTTAKKPTQLSAPQQRAQLPAPGAVSYCEQNPRR